MPELPEVETMRRLISRTLKGRTITKCLVAANPFMFGKLSETAIKKAAIHYKLTSTGRKGKYLWLTFSSDKSLIIHLGMTGWFEKSVELEKFGRLTLVAGKKGVCFTDPRKFGRVWLAAEPEEHPRIKGLGDDCYFNPPTPIRLKELLGARRIAVKAALLNQKLFAGIGNWIADEVLYHAGIDPQRSANSLGSKELSKLSKSIKKIIAFAVDAEGDEESFPKNWLFHYRWQKKHSFHPFTKKKITHIVVGGRTTAWVPEVQR